MRPITIGSLFDGIGAFPLGASFFNADTLWASEILPTAISVTRRHFPNTLHVGDVTKLSGKFLRPCTVICFGSPCTDLSVAGKREGLGGKQSSLFYEAIRIIREMRCATDGRYPRYAIFENVPGLFSSNSGRDYQAVLEAFTESKIPMPASGKWANAGMVRSDRVDLAWCVYDAQHFGLAQRRKRCFIVADFGGTSAGEILFKPKSLYGHFASCGETRQKATAVIGEGFALAIREVYGICSLNSNSMKSANPLSGVYKADTARTLDNTCGNPSCNQGGMAVVEILNDQGGSSLTVEKNGRTPTLRHSAHGNLPIICLESGDNLATYCLQGNMLGRDDRHGPAGGGMNEEVSFTLNSTDRHAVAAIPINMQIATRHNALGEKTAFGVGKDGDPAFTLLEAHSHAVAHTFGNNSLGGWSEKSATIKTSGGCIGGGSENIVVKPSYPPFIVRRLTPVECERLMGFPDGWTAFGHDGQHISDNKRYQMLGNSIAVPCVAYIMQGIMEQFEKEESNGSQNQ